MRAGRVWRAAALCAVLVLSGLRVGGGAGDRPSGTSADASTEGTKPAVSHPGAATGKHGGVAPPTVGVPPGSQAARLPVPRAPTRPGGGPTAASPVTLDAMQGSLLERVNHHRTLAGVAAVSPEVNLLRAAQAHASYLNSTGQAGHYETQGTDAYYTGRTPFQRIAAAGYDYVAAGEVVGNLSSGDPAAVVDALMMAIYHRFIILSSVYTEAGLGVATRRVQGSDMIDVTVDFGSRTLPAVRPPSALTTYPADGQRGVPLDFDPAHEAPNPMPGHALVGYPISVQVDERHDLRVDAFTLKAVGQGNSGSVVAVKRLTHAINAETPAYAAAVIPLSPLSPATAYRVTFSGRVGSVPVTKSWQFTTAARTAPRLRFASPAVAPGGTQRATIDGLDREKGDYYVCYAPPHLVASLAFEGDAAFALTTSTDCNAGKSCQVAVSTSYQSSCAAPFAQGTFVIAP